jgi:Flp pilus assembly protein TadD
MQRRDPRYYASAERFYEAKLQINPEMPRYNHLMAAIASERGLEDKANNYYRQAITVQPGNLMTRNDYAVHLARSNRKEDALHEFKKAELVVENNSVLQKNYAATLGNAGQFNAALTAATKSRHLDPYDAMNHRNLARIHAALGDARSSLEHNMTAIQLENPRTHPHPNTTAFRAAAVQIIAKGGRREEAFALMDTARQLEHKTADLATSVQTRELIARIKKRYGNSLADIEKEKQEQLNKQLIYDYDNPNNVLKDIRQMKLTRSIKT